MIISIKSLLFGDMFLIITVFIIRHKNEHLVLLVLIGLKEFSGLFVLKISLVFTLRFYSVKIPSKGQIMYKSILR